MKKLESPLLSRLNSSSKNKFKSDNNLKTVHTKSIEAKSNDELTAGAGRTSLKNHLDENKSSQRS